MRCTPERTVISTSLFGEITVPRAYRAYAEGDTGNSLMPLGLPLLLHAGTHKIHIEHWTHGQTRPLIKAIRLRLWPPLADVDDTDVWPCPCPRPGGHSVSGPGHWDVRMLVKFEMPSGDTKPAGDGDRASQAAS